MTKSLIILVFLIAGHAVLSQKIYHLDKKKAPKLLFNEMKRLPDKSNTYITTTSYDYRKIPKVEEYRPLPKPVIADFKETIVAENSVSKPIEIEIVWKSKTLRAYQELNVPDFLFKDISTRNIKYLDKAHGFISNKIITICQDSLGIIWLGTGTDGLCRLSGSSMKVYNKQSGLPSNNINKVFIDRNGIMWISTSNGVAFIKNNTIYYSGDEILSDGSYTEISEDHSGNIWLASQKHGAIKITNNKIEVFDSNSGLPGNIVNVVFEDKEGNIWFGLNTDGFCRYDGDKFYHYFLSKSPEYNSVKSFYEYDGAIWIGIFQSPLVKYVNGKFYKYKLFEIRQPTAYSFTENRFGLWIALYGQGLMNIKGNMHKLYNPSDGLVGNNSYSVYNDANNNLWIADLSSGLSRFDENLFYSNKESSEIPMKVTEGIKKDKDGNIWYLPNGGFLVKEDNTHYTVFDNTKYLPLYALRHAFDGEFMANGDIFLSTYSMGVLKINDTKFEYTKFDSGNYVMESSSVKPNEIWFSTMFNGLKKYDYKSYYDITSKHGLSGDKITRIKHDKRGRLWVAVADKGVDIIDNNTIAHVDKEAGLSSNNTTFFYNDDRRFWIASENGINIIEGDSMLILNRSTGLISNKIRSIIKDKRNNYWIGTSDGISKVKFTNDSSIEVQNYESEHGLNITDFNSTVFLLDDGRIRWGTTNNILTAIPENENINQNEIKLNLESITFNDTTISNIDYFKNVFEIYPGKSLALDFFFVDWGYESSLKYEYSIINYGEEDTIWRNNGKSSELLINDLPTGDYTVLLRAFSNNKVSNIKVIKLSFMPHWWESKGFVVLLIVFFIIIGPLIFLYYSYLSRKKRQKLELLVNEKTNELLEENKIKDALVQEIHHRVKNNLQSITSLVEMQLYSTQNEGEKKALIDTQLRISAMALVHEMLYSSDDFGKVSAKNYLEELVNSINEMSNTKKLPIEFVLEVEDFTIGMANCISFGLLTSEIISNSIKYAFKNTRDPLIKVSFHLNDSAVLYTIKDNGVGFNPESVDEEKSLGLRLINIFAKQLDSKFGYEFDSGTTVKLIIPKQKLI